MTSLFLDYKTGENTLGQGKKNFHATVQEFPSQANLVCKNNENFVEERTSVQVQRNIFMGV